MSKLVFKSFSSGSCGNCYFLALREEDGTVSAGILIDAGVSIRRLKKELGADGFTLDDFSAVLVTHDHMDHIRSLGSYCKHLGKPVWASPALIRALSHHMMCYEYLPGCKNVLEADAWNEIIPGKVSVRFFVVPHDASETVGFAIRIGDHFYTHITDCGRMTEEALAFCSQADSVTIESNYDNWMLDNGSYPYELKVRIRNGNGHMSNDECACAIETFHHEGLRNLFLCHLSENNNTPEKAYESARAALAKVDSEGKVRLQTLPRQTPSPLIIL